MIISLHVLMRSKKIEYRLEFFGFRFGLSFWITWQIWWEMKISINQIRSARLLVHSWTIELFDEREERKLYHLYSNRLLILRSRRTSFHDFFFGWIIYRIVSYFYSEVVVNYSSFLAQNTLVLHRTPSIVAFLISLSDVIGVDRLDDFASRF